MKAVQIPRRAGAFEVVEVATPEPSSAQVRIKVEACGVCHGEIVAIEGHWPGGVSYPRIPGHEVIGIIDAVGADAGAWKVGQRVGVGWSGGLDKVTGLTVDGGYAEYTVARADALVAIPDGVSPAAAAPLMCAGVTVFSALKRSAARMGDVVAVQGIGGLGHLAVQFAQRAGFRTVAISRGRDKEALAHGLGAHHYIDGASEDVGQALMALGGAKVVIATAPSAKAISAAVGGLARDGEVVIVAGSSEKLDVSPMQLLRRASIRGWVGDGPPDIVDTVRFSLLTGVETKVETFRLDQATEAYNRMMSADVRFRAVLTMG
jgi:propanol-preferring alcohol dehydrogenase